MTAGMMPFIPVMAVSVISFSEKPCSLIMIAALKAASIKASIGLALDVNITAPNAKPMTRSTGNTKFQNKLVRTCSAGWMPVKSSLING